MPTGFTPDTIDFLVELGKNNHKEWFTAHRSQFEQHLLQPLAELVGELSDPMLDIDPAFETRPAIGKTIARIHRDTRFSRDKSPYRTNLWITFKRPATNWQENPAYFFDIAADHYRYGMGFYAAGRETMDRIRAEIDHRPEKFLAMTDFLQKQQQFTLEGELYKKPLNKSLAPQLAEWHQRKNVHLLCQQAVGPQLFSKQLVTELRNGFDLLAPLYHFFWQLKDG